MSTKTLPFTGETLAAILEKHPTPFHLYDEAAIRRNARALSEAFSWNKGFREYFAVKAAPNPYLLKMLSKEGFGADCSSLPELLLAERVGVVGEHIMFTSNDTPPEEFQKAKELGAIINLDDISHIPFLEACAGVRGAILHGHVHRCYRVDVPGVSPTLFGAGSTTEEGNEGFWLFDIDEGCATATRGGFRDGRYSLVGAPHKFAHM